MQGTAQQQQKPLIDEVARKRENRKNPAVGAIAVEGRFQAVFYETSVATQYFYPKTDASGEELVAHKPLIPKTVREVTDEAMQANQRLVVAWETAKTFLLVNPQYFDNVYIKEPAREGHQAQMILEFSKKARGIRSGVEPLKHAVGDETEIAKAREAATKLRREIENIRNQNTIVDSRQKFLFHKP